MSVGVSSGSVAVPAQVKRLSLYTPVLGEIDTLDKVGAVFWMTTSAVPMVPSTRPSLGVTRTFQVSPLAVADDGTDAVV